jgi:hypothetical protein
MHHNRRHGVRRHGRSPLVLIMQAAPVACQSSSWCVNIPCTVGRGVPANTHFFLFLAQSGCDDEVVPPDQMSQLWQSYSGVAAE